MLGCRLARSGSFAEAEATGVAVGRLAEGFTAQGWDEMIEFATDGKDGTAFAFRKTGVACHVRGAWNGGSDGAPRFPEKIGTRCR